MAGLSAHIPTPRFVDALDGQTYRVLCEHVTFKAVAADTNGAYSLFKICTPPDHGMPLHYQRYEDETLWVVQGTYRVHLAGEQLELKAGDYVFVPRGTLHSYINSGNVMASLLVLVTPGGIQERFYAEVGERLVVPAMDSFMPSDAMMTQFMAVAQKFGIEILPR